jgi:hypothetical protein
MNQVKSMCPVTRISPVTRMSLKMRACHVGIQMRCKIHMHDKPTAAGTKCIATPRFRLTSQFSATDRSPE